MTQYISLIIIGLWFLYALLIKLTKKRKYDLSFSIALVFLLAYGYFYFQAGFDHDYFELFQYITGGVFAVWLMLDNVVLLFKKNVSGYDFHNLERKIEHVKEVSELLRRRFISTIELFEDGISFREGDAIFGTDRFIEIMGLETNDFTVKDLEQIIVKEDFVEYQNILAKCTNKAPKYSIKYRVKIRGRNEWILERGTLLMIDKKRTYISIVKKLDVKLYPRTEIDVLNYLPNTKEMMEEMMRLHRHKKSYHLVLIELTNIPKINELYGRDFGDIMMGDYLSNIRFKFIKDNRSLFRISGLIFGLIIKDESKYKILDRALVGAGELFTLKKTYGGNEMIIYPSIGIAEAPYEGKNADIVFREANEALKRAKANDYEDSFYFFK